ncbi:MAG TPA: hypothetical protein VGJ84_20225, partial [Polyangiaceae bacterium]
NVEPKHRLVKRNYGATLLVDVPKMGVSEKETPASLEPSAEEDQEQAPAPKKKKKRKKPVKREEP